MKGHPIASAIVVFFVGGAVFGLVANAVIKAPEGATEDERKAKQYQAMGIAGAFQLGATIVAYYTNK